jgi:peptidoglycan DL-endopeptidase CwlO
LRRLNLQTAAALVLIFAAGIFAPRVPAAEESLGHALKRIFQPTPTPAPKKKHKTSSSGSKKKSSPTPSPSPKERAASDSPTPTPSPSPQHSTSPKPTASPKNSPSPTETPEPSPSPKAKHSPSPSATPRKKKKKASPTPEPTATATPSPEEEEASPSPRASATPTSEESPTVTPSPEKKNKSAATISPNDIVAIDEYPPEIRKIIEAALSLTAQNLEYKYGSSDPSSGGLDCSGLIYYVLTQSGVKDVPRDASGQYAWVRKSHKFQAVISHNDKTFEMDELKPGDLLFWTGTYDVEKDPPITHIMIYLGREKGTNERVMVGASDGRTYHGESRYGVGVFDFKVSRPGTTREGRTPAFVGYGPIPGLGEAGG